MRDDRDKWPAVLGLKRQDVVRDRISIREVSLTRQTVLSGAVADCLSLSGIGSAVGGGPDVAVGETFALRQRRDRIVIINGPLLQDGWNIEHNVAVSDMSAAYAVLEISGVMSEQIIATGTEFDGRKPSPSVSRLWHGFGILLYRYGNEDTYRMHVRSAYFEAVWEMIERQIDGLTRIWADDAQLGAVANHIQSASLACKEAC